MPLKVVAQWLQRAPDKIRHENRIIARDMALIGVFILLAKIAGAAKESVVAWRFGTSPEVDAYLFVFNLVNVPVAVTYSVLHAVLIPLLIRLRASDPSDECRFRSELAGALFLLGLLFSALLWLPLRFGLPGAAGFEDAAHLTRQAGDYLVLTIPLGLLVSYGSVLLMTSGRHLNSLLEGVPPLVLLVVLVAWSGGDMRALLIGTAAGSVMHLAVVVFAIGGQRSVVAPRVAFRSAGWLQLRSGVGMMLFAQFMLALTTVVDQFFAAHIGAGAVSTLGYATRVLGLILALGATTIGRATLPIYSRLGAEGQGQLSQTATQWTLLLFIMGLGVMAISLPLSEWGVRLLFERGAFTRADTLAVAEALRWGLVQVPFYFAMIAASQALFSTSRYGLAATLAAANLLIKFVMNALLIPHLGVSGLMASTAVMYATSCIFLLCILRRGRPARRGLSAF